MTVEELMRPRYKVIADYPGMDYNVGNIIYMFDDGSGNHSKDEDGGFIEWEAFYQEFPHLFKKLEWWEDRAIEDMPEYVKCTKTPDQKIMPGDILKPVWNGIGGKTGGHYIFLYTNCFTPGTEAEYNAYQNSKQNG